MRVHLSFPSHTVTWRAFTSRASTSRAPAQTNRFIVIVMLVCTSVNGFAADYQPATIGEHETSLAKRIAFPDVAGEYTLYLRCEAKVQPAGSIAEIGCYDEEGVDKEFYRAVGIASQSATVRPARVDDANVSVLMFFSVIFRQRDGSSLVAVVPNHGTNAKELGLGYVAPQRYGRANTYYPRSELGLLWVDTTITTAGRARGAKYIKTKYTNKETQRYAKYYIRDNRFIPGFVDGAPREMRFVKPIFGHRNGFMWSAGHDKCGNSQIKCDEVSKVTGRPRFTFED